MQTDHRWHNYPDAKVFSNASGEFQVLCCAGSNELRGDQVSFSPSSPQMIGSSLQYTCNATTKEACVFVNSAQPVFCQVIGWRLYQRINVTERGE